MQPTPSIILRTFDGSKHVLCHEVGTLDNLNVSHIATRLIQEVGRFCERYASDFLISWDTVREHLEPRPIEEPYRAVEVFGIRRSGVDHNSFFMSHLRNDSRNGFFCCEYVYRKVLALEIAIHPGNYYGGCSTATCTLKDLTDELWRVEPGDLEENAAYDI